MGASPRLQIIRVPARCLEYFNLYTSEGLILACAGTVITDTESNLYLYLIHSVLAHLCCNTEFNIYIVDI